MRLFFLSRQVDVSGTSGTGIVAEGVIFDNGVCTMTWLSAIKSVEMFNSIRDLKKIHGHNGATRVIISGKAIKEFMESKSAARLKTSILKHGRVL